MCLCDDSLSYAQVIWCWAISTSEMPMCFVRKAELFIMFRGEI